MKNAYFDNNIIIGIEDGYLELEKVIQKVDPEITNVFYSASHLQEAKEIKGNRKIRKERIERRLDSISKITNNSYLNEELSTRKVKAYIEHPSVVWNTISEVSWANWFVKRLINFVSQKNRNKFRQLLNLETSKLNNYEPSEVIEHLNKKLEGYGDGMTFIQMIEHGVSQHPQGQTFGLSNRIAGIFELLDLLGYWKDKYNKKSNYARLWDSSHTFYAAHTNYFVSRDKRTRNKAKVVYHQYGIETKVANV